MSQKVRGQRWYERRPRLVPLAIFLLAMGITLLAVVAIAHAERTRQNEHLQAAGLGLASALERQAAAHIAYLRAGAALLTSADMLNEEGFRDYLSDARNQDENLNSEGESWAPWLRPAEVPAFEAERRAHGQPAYAVHPAPQPGARAVVPVTWLGRPNPESQGALGYDLYSDPVRRAALIEAVRHRRPAITGRAMLRQWSGRPVGPGFILYVPVFARLPGRPLAGFITAAFNAHTFLASAVALGQTQGFGEQSLGVALYDGPVAPDHLLARLGPAGGGSWLGGWLMGGERSVWVPVVMARRTMTLVVATSAGAGLPLVAWVVLVAGSLVALLLMIMAYMAAKQAGEDRASLAWLREQASIRDSLARELNHRVKNTLANVLSIVALTRYRAANIEEFAEGLAGRIRALSATHDLLTGSDWGPTPIGALIAAELAPYAEGHETAVTMAGPPVELAPNDALLLGLAVHELATNACKYGALSVVGGRVEISWQQPGPGLVEVHWAEAGGPAVSAQRHRGFGTELLERILAHELGHAVHMDFAPGGLRCQLVVPVRSPAKFLMRAKAAAQGAAGAASAGG